MKVSICLLTCERLDYTRTTLETLAAHNDLSAFTLLHADDASEDARLPLLGRTFGFDTLPRPSKRQGVMEMQRRLVAESHARGCDWTIILQNDWETVRPFPWALLRFADAIPNVYCMRLYGVWKGRGVRPAGPRHNGRNNADPGWRAIGGAPEPAEIGSIHWCSPPAATRTELAAWLLKDAKKDRDARLRSGELDDLTIRPVENVVYHFGIERTPAFKP